MSILLTAASVQGVLLLGAGIGDVGPELGIGPSELGILTALFFISSSITSGPAGRLVARIGWQAAVRFNAAAIGVLLLVIAGLAWSTIVLGIILIVMGGVYGLANPAVNQALADHVDPRHRGLIFGLKHAGIPTSTLLAGAAVPVIILNFGWRWAFVAGAALAFTLLLIVPGGGFEPSAHHLDEDPRRTVEPLRPELLRWLAGAGLLGTVSVVGLSTFLVASLVDDGFTAATAGWIQFGGALFSIVARVTYGLVTDRYGLRGFAAVAALLGIGGIVFLAFVPAAGWTLAFLVGAGFATAWGWPGLFTYSVVNANPRSAAASSATAYAGVFAGAALGPVIVGEIIDRASFEASWIFIGLCLIIASVAMFRVSRHVVARTISAETALSRQPRR
jgi:MFS family permease